MNAPRGLGSDGRRCWRNAIGVLSTLGIHADQVAEPLGRLAVLADDLAACRAAWRTDGAKFTAPGSARQEQPHPLLRVQRDLRAEMLAIETELGLTPASARKLGHVVRGGRPTGATSALDRRTTYRRTANVVALPTRLQRLLDDADAG